MKKFLIILLMLILIPQYSFASHDTDLTYSVNESYEWEIHTAINFGSNAGVNQTEIEQQNYPTKRQ